MITLRPEQRELILAHRLDRLAVDRDAARARSVEPGEQREQR